MWLSPGMKPTAILLSVGCGLSSSTRDQGGAGQSLGGARLHGQPLLGQRVEEKRRPGAAQLTVGTSVCVTMAWTPVLLVLLSYCTGRDRPRRNWQLSKSLFLSQHLDKFLPVSCPINHTVLAGSLSQPVLTQRPSLCISGIIHQTHLHLQHWVQCW